MQNQFTPGPWKVNEYNYIQGAGSYVLAAAYDLKDDNDCAEQVLGPVRHYRKRAIIRVANLTHKGELMQTKHDWWPVGNYEANGTRKTLAMQTMLAFRYASFS